MTKITVLIIMIFFAVAAGLHSQTSLYGGRNPYVASYNDGEIIRVNVNNTFAISINGEWNRNFEVSLKLDPDKKNLPFLQESRENRNSSRQSKERQNVSEKFKFLISAIITRQPGGNYRINANKIINMDGKITRIVCTGLVDEKSIVNGTVNSDEVADLNLIVISQPQPSRDETFNIEEGEVKEDQEKTEGAERNFSKEQMKKYIIEYLKEILGALK